MNSTPSGQQSARAEGSSERADAVYERVTCIGWTARMGKSMPSAARSRRAAGRSAFSETPRPDENESSTSAISLVTVQNISASRRAELIRSSRRSGGASLVGRSTGGNRVVLGAGGAPEISP